MRTALLTLISFSVLTLCTGICPMNMGAVSQTSAVHPGMTMAEMDHMDMTQGDREPCAQCRDRADDELAVTNLSSPAGALVTAPTLVVAVAVPSMIDHSVVVATPLFVADTGPPPVPALVRTVVLRT